MRDIIESGAFRRDLRKAKKRNKNLSKLYAVVECLAKGEPLAPRHKPHPLKGNWKPKWDCHVEPDWVLIYEVTETVVKRVRTGMHSDVF